MKIEIKPKPLTREAFKKFGEVIEKEGRDSMMINRGSAEKFYEICNMDTNEKGGVTTLHIYVGNKREFPLLIDMLEKHPLFSQTFIPRSKEPFYCAVALGGREPDLSTLEIFETNGDQGVHYNKGVWHFPLICIKDKEEFIVLDRAETNKDEKLIVEQIEYNMKDEEIYLVKD
ncbi:ureidoglycolate lyase [Campylobacterota bacterium DY0563]